MDWMPVLHNLWADYVVPFFIQCVVPAAGTVAAALFIMLLNALVLLAKAKVATIQNQIMREAILRLVEAAEKKFTEPSVGTTKYAWVAQKAKELYGIELDEHEIEASVYALGKVKGS